MDIFETIENYESLKEEYNEAESRAIEYENEYESLRNCGWDDQDSMTHSVGLSALHYDNEMVSIENEMRKYDDILNNLGKALVNEFQKIEINTLLKKLGDWYCTYGCKTNVYSFPLFFSHDNDLMLLDDMITCDYINDFKWSLQKNDYIIIIENKEIKGYTQKNFFNWLIKDLNSYTLFDDGVTEELENLLEIIKSTY